MQQQGIWTTSASAYNNGFASGHNNDATSPFSKDVTPASKTNVAFRRSKSETSCASLVTPKQLKSKPRRRLGFFSRSKSTECHQVRLNNGHYWYLVIMSGLFSVVLFGDSICGDFNDARNLLLVHHHHHHHHHDVLG